jgi:hypothetical protein
MVDILTGFHMLRLIKGEPVPAETGACIVDIVLKGLAAR